MDTDLDLRQLEKASESIDRLIESREATEQEASEARAWAASVQRYDMAKARELRQQWRDYYAARIALFEELAAENRTKLHKLIDEKGA